MGEEVDLCVPTGNFGNILAAWYARAMGLPVRRLFCASNRNHILTDFFRTGIYDTHREFHRTSSPSMDILISSNLERFLFEITGRDAGRIKTWFTERFRKGVFEIDAETKKAMDELIVPGWADEPRVFAEIKKIYEETGLVIDTHTAVASAVSRDRGAADGPAVDHRLDGQPVQVRRRRSGGHHRPGRAGRVQGHRASWAELAGEPPHRAVRGLQGTARPARQVLTISQMREAVIGFADGLRAALSERTTP